MFQNDSNPLLDPPASLSAARERLTAALDRMEARLPSLMDDLSRISTQATEQSGMASDRAQLAARLDDSEARAQGLERELATLRAQTETAAEREARMREMSEQTRSELDATIATLRDVLGG